MRDDGPFRWMTSRSIPPLAFLPIGSRFILGYLKQRLVDEFAPFEVDLHPDSRTVDLEELVLDIEGSIVEPELFFKRMVRTFNSQLKYTLFVMGIVLLPLFGIGIPLIVMSLSNGPLDEDTTTVKATAYVKEHRLLTEYHLQNSTVKMARMFPLTDASYLTLRTSYGGEYDDRTYHSYSVHSGARKYELLHYRQFHNPSDAIQKQIEMVHDFAAMSGLSFRAPE